MRTSVIIVNYRTADLVCQCLASLAPLRDEAEQLRAVVVDNASNDGSPKQIAEAIAAQGWQDWVSLMPLDHNSGFSAGNNAAIRAMACTSDNELFFLLNPDTIVKPGAIAHLVQFMADHEDVGIAGSCLEDPDGTVHNAARRFPSPLGELEGGMRLGFVSRWLRGSPTNDQPQSCDWVSGAAMMVRRTVFEKVGLLDEEYFLYFEEVDFCRRAKRAGWAVWHIPASRVIHLEGAATTQTHATPARSPWWVASRKRYFIKTHGRAALLLADICAAAGRASFTVRRALGLTRTRGGHTA